MRRIIAVLCFSLAFALPPIITAGAAIACTGTQVATTQNLATVAASKPAGTTFCLATGTHKLTVEVRPEPGDIFQGQGRTLTFIVPTGINTPRNGFTPTGSSDGDTPITYRDLDIGGFKATASSTTCGANGGCGTAIGLSNLAGSDTVAGGVVLTNVTCHDNGTACVARGTGSLVATGFTCTRNGFHANTRSGTYVANTCVKVNEGSLNVQNSTISDNYAIGLWCDFCGRTAFIVENSVMNGNGRAAIQWEVSGHFFPGDFARVKGNTITNNGDGCGTVDGFSLNSGILVSNAHNITIENNTFGGNISCSKAGTGGVPNGKTSVRIYNNPNRGVPASSGVLVRNNTLAGDPVKSCTTAGVTCSGNTP